MAPVLASNKAKPGIKSNAVAMKRPSGLKRMGSTNWPFVEPILFSPDGRFIATAFDFIPGFALFDASTGAMLHNFVQPQAPKSTLWLRVGGWVKGLLKIPPSV